MGDHAALQRPGSLRERKKAHTRRRLIETSQRLFLANGYAETTLEEIAAEVEINVKTLLRYFPSKQELALALERQALDHCMAGLADPGRTGSAVDYYGDFIRAMAVDWQHEDNRSGRLGYFFLLTSEPTIVAQSMVLQRAYEDALTEAIARDAGRPADADIYARLLAAMLVNSVHAVVRQWATARHDGDLPAMIAALQEFCQTEFPSRADATRLADPGIWRTLGQPATQAAVRRTG